MPFKIEPVRPLKRSRAVEDDEPYAFAPKKQLRMDFDISDSDSTGTMEIDDMHQTNSTSTETTADYQMSTPEPEAALQKYYYGPGLLAFPPTLDIFSVEGTNWYWNATSWLTNRHLDPVECSQITSHIQSQQPFYWPPADGVLSALQLGTSEDMITRTAPKFSTFVVFPSIPAATLASEPFLRAWTDAVMVPSVLAAARKREGFTYGVPAYARSYRAVRMASDCNRIVNPSVPDVPDTPVSVKLRADEVGEVWASMQRIVHNDPLTWAGFEDMFLVVVAGADSETGMRCYGSDLRSFWSHFSARFDRAVNMGCVPAECVTISPKVYYGCDWNNVD